MLDFIVETFGLRDTLQNVLKNLNEHEPLLTNISNTEEATLPSSGHFLIKHIFNAELPNKVLLCNV